MCNTELAYLDLIEESEQNCDLQPLNFGPDAEVSCIEVGLGSVLVHNHLLTHRYSTCTSLAKRIKNFKFML